MQKILLGILLIIMVFLEPVIMAAQTVLVTGANRGMGLEYAKQLKTAGYEVIGTARKPERAVELKKRLSAGCRARHSSRVLLLASARM